MKRWGVTTPVLVDEDGVLIYGHGRRAAAELLGYAELPVAIARGWTEDEKRAYRLADNQTALLSTWDEPALRQEYMSLHHAGFDMPLLAFPQLKMVEFVAGDAGGGAPGQGGDDDTSEGDRDLTPEERALMIGAWQTMAADWVDILQKQAVLSTNFTKGALAVYFLRARFFGSAIPSAATLAYTPHRVAIIGDGTKDKGHKPTTQGGSILDGLRLALTNEGNIIERLWFVLSSQPRLDKLLGGSLPFLAFRLPGDFPPALACALYDEFVPEGGRILDPCHGWGGRMLGFLLSKAAHYHGFDVDPRTRDGVLAMFNDLMPLAASDKTSKLELKPFEDAKLTAASYDFALTSPPYFNIEKYGGDLSSWKRYDTFEKWVPGFYQPMIAKVAKALKPGATFALQVGNQVYPLEQIARDFAPTVGLDHVGTRASGMVNNFHDTAEADGEVVVLLRRRSANGAALPPAAESPAPDPAGKYGRLL